MNYSRSILVSILVFFCSSCKKLNNRSNLYWKESRFNICKNYKCPNRNKNFLSVDQPHLGNCFLYSSCLIMINGISSFVEISSIIKIISRLSPRFKEYQELVLFSWLQIKTNLNFPLLVRVILN